MQKKAATPIQGTLRGFPHAEVRSRVAEYLETIGYTCNRIPLLDRIERLAAMIALWGDRMNLTAEPDNPQELAFHIIDSLSPVILGPSDERLREALRAGNRVLDLGSGAGFPGLVLASATAANFTLTESRRKRANFLAFAAAELHLTNVVVEAQRITHERPGAGGSSANAPTGASTCFDVVMARAFAVPSAFHLTAAPLLRPEGSAILYANTGQDVALPQAARHGLYDFRSMTYRIPRGSHVVSRMLALWQKR